MTFPDLSINERDREYRGCSEQVRDRMVYEYLFNAKSHRWLDANVAERDPEYSRGYVSMGTLHHLGLIEQHKGFFTDVSISDAISFLKNIDDENVQRITQSLLRVSQSIYSDDNTNLFYLDDDEEAGYSEGRQFFRTHRVRERNPEVVRKAKERFKRRNNGQLFCEVCGFNFLSTYGERGAGFIEGHHRLLVSEMSENERTKVEDIAMLCPNCHRMIHKAPLLTVEELAATITQE